MHLRYWVLVLMMLGTFGCRTICHKRSAAAPPPLPPYLPPVATAPVAPAPGPYTPPPLPTAPPPTSSNRLPDVLTPEPLSPIVPQAPREGFVRSAPPAPQPRVLLLPPQFATPEPPAAPPVPTQTPEPPAAPPPGPSTSAKESLPGSIPQFVYAMPDRVAVGRKPFLEGAGWLAANGFKSVLYLRKPGTPDEAHRRQFEAKGLKFSSLAVAPDTLDRQTVGTFTRLVGDASAQPMFVYDESGDLVGGLFYVYLRKIDHATEDEARVRAGAFGLRESGDADHRAMANAARQYLSLNP